MDQTIDLTADDSDEAAPDLAQLHREREARQPWRLRRPGASWTGEAKYDDDEVRELRKRLTRTNHGSPGLEVLRPGEDGGYDVERAASLFRRDGCVVLLDALDPARLVALRRGVERGAAVVPYAVPAGNRGAQRWSLGVASLTRQLSHVKAWADCVHVPRIAPVLEEIMGPNYVCTGMGGELTAPGAVDYQELHSDLGDGDVVYDGVRMKNWDAPSAPAVVVNFAVCDLHGLNGPTAQVTAAVAGFSTQTRRCPGDADPRRDEFRLSTVLVGAACPPAPSSSATPRVARGHGERHGRRAPAAAERGVRAGLERGLVRAVDAAARPRGPRRRGPAPARASSTTSPTGPTAGARSIRASTAGRSATATRSASTASTRPPRPPSPSSRSTTTASSTSACAAPSPRRTPTPATPSTSRRRRRSPRRGLRARRQRRRRRPARSRRAAGARSRRSTPPAHRLRAGYGSRASPSASRTATASSTSRSSSYVISAKQQQDGYGVVDLKIV